MKPPFTSTLHRSQVVLTMPRLSDQAVIQIHDFLHQALDLFEDHYGEQIEKFYQALTEPSYDGELDLGDSPF
jgi:hypothetical protein